MSGRSQAWISCQPLSFQWPVLLPIALALSVELGIGGANDPSLQEIINLVRSNEEKLSLIRMSFRADFAREGSNPDFVDPRVGGEAYKVVRHEIEWAQDGILQCFIRQSTYDDRTLGELTVVDGEVCKAVGWPERKRGEIAPISDYDHRWLMNFASILYYRILWGASPRLVSDVLASEEVISGIVMQRLDGRDVFVLDVRIGSGYTRLYIDKERGLLLRSDLYGGSADGTEKESLLRTEVTKIHQLENGGWVGVEGLRTFYGQGYTRFIRVHVDVNSISVNRADIPDSLFELDFPADTIVTNKILGIASKAMADRVARRSLDELYAMEEPQQDGNPPEDGGIQEHNIPAGPNETQDARETSVANETTLDHNAITDSSSRDLAWRWGLSQLGLFLIVAGATIFVLLIRKRRKA